ncbi:MAG: histidine kinase [Kangiellaceae bacterium]
MSETTIHLVDNLRLGAQSYSKQNHQFWMLQIAGWSGYLVVVFMAIIRPQIGEQGFNFAGQIFNLFVETMVGFGLSYFQWIFIRKIVHFPLRLTILLSFVSAATLGIIFNIFKLGAYKVIVFDQQWNEDWNMLEFGGWLLFSIATMFVWTSIYFIMLYNTKLQKEHEKLLRAETAAKDAQLQMLRYQLNPHFMFNTMNAISTLIYKNDNERANEMLDKLCEFFRYTLDKSDRASSPLHKEIELLELYLSIEKARFGRRLNVDINVDNELMDCRIPYMLLQPIVENSIKYAIEPSKLGGTIYVNAKAIEHRLQIQIIDQGEANKDLSREGFGIGLRNTEARLDAMYNGDFSMELEACKEAGSIVTINTPIKK